MDKRATFRVACYIEPDHDGQIVLPMRNASSIFYGNHSKDVSLPSLELVLPAGKAGYFVL